MASIFSIHKFYNDVKIQGFKVSKDTIHNYLSYLRDAFLVFTVPNYLESERLRQTRPKKLYAIDSGLVRAVSIDANRNYGRFLENLVYLDLRRQHKDVYYYNTSGGYEVDFIAVSQDGSKELIQVTWDMSDESTLQREKRALEEAESELGINGRIITAYDYLRDSCHA